MDLGLLVDIIEKRRKVSFTNKENKEEREGVGGCCPLLKCYALGRGLVGVVDCMQW